MASLPNTLGKSLLLASLALGTAQAANIEQLTQDITPQVIEWRRDIHQNPELSNREFRTAGIVKAHLESLGLEVETDVAHTGVIGLLKGAKPGPLIAFRADMDALPVPERVPLPFASKVMSQHRGLPVPVSHACGHDAHTAMLMGVAQNLASMRDELAGDVMFIFQPAEEGAPEGEEGGAELMLAEGLFDGRTPDQAFALHVTSSINTGKVGIRAGAAMASADGFSITVKGKPTHGSIPWQGVDPIVASAQIINSLQNIVAREVDLTKTPAVLGFGAINGGNRANIIPEQVELLGNVRTFDQGVREFMHQRMETVIQHTATAMGAQAELRFDVGYPATINNPGLVDAIKPVLAQVVGAENVTEPPMVTGADDFAFFANEVPSVYFFLGVTPVGKNPREAATIHTPFFYLDEKALAIGVESLTRIAASALAAQ